MGFNLIFVIVIFGLFWVLLLRPQRRRAMIQRDLLSSLEPGDEIVSSGGLFGVITSVDGDELHVEVADGIVVRMARRAVAGLVERDEVDEDEPEEADVEPIEDESPNPS